MRPRRPPRAHALAPALALLGGMLLAPAEPVESSVGSSVAIALLLLAALLCGGPSRRRAGGLLVFAACLALGAWIGGIDRQRTPGGLVGLLEGPGSVAHVHLRGELLAAPESGRAGESWLRLRGRVERAEIAAPALEVRLRVMSSAREADALLDTLGAGDVVRIWCRLRLPQRSGNPGAHDAARSMRGLGLDVQGTVKSARLVEPLRRGGPGPRRWLDTMHRSARRRLDRIATNGSPTRAVLGAMLLGDRAALPAETARALRGAGLAHLLAISGLHVGLIVFGLFSLLRRWGSTGWTSVILACTGLSGFGMFVGGRPSVARAVAAAAALLLGRRLGREGDALNTIALVAAGLALSRPAVLWNLGYQLSFLATAGILCSSAALSRALPLPGPLGAGIAVSLSAYLATGPVVAASFGGLAPAGILINLISLPLCAVILASGYAAILLQELPGAGAWLGWCSSGAVDLLLDVGRNAGRVGWHGVHPPSAWLILGYYTSALLLIVEHRGARQNQRARQALLALFAVATVWLHVGDLPPSAPAEIEAHVLDVGQGQAVAIRGPSGAWFVVDAGGSGPGRFDPGERIVLPALRRAGARRLAALIVTHEDADHAGGAFALLRELEVGQLWMGPGWHREPRMRALAELALERGASLRQVERGESSMLAGLPLRVLAPGREQLAWDSNDRSLVLSIGTAPARLLIPGDLETAGERGLLADGSPLSADVLIVPHHGSRNGSSAAFLDRVAAGHAVVSCGRRNNFGHPHPEVVERLRARGTRLWRTDRQGRIRIRGGPGGLRIDGYIAPPGKVTR